MPISVRTMRDIWDEERIERKERKKRKMIGKLVVPEKVRGEYLDYLEIREKSLAEIRKYLLDYLERKKYSVEAFGLIERDLGEAGFSF